MTQTVSSIGRARSICRMNTRNTATSVWTRSASFSSCGTAFLVKYIFWSIALSLQVILTSRYTLLPVGRTQTPENLKTQKSMKWFWKMSSNQLKQNGLRGWCMRRKRTDTYVSVPPFENWMPQSNEVLFHSLACNSVLTFLRKLRCFSFMTLTVSIGMLGLKGLTKINRH